MINLRHEDLNSETEEDQKEEEGTTFLTNAKTRLKKSYKTENLADVVESLDVREDADSSLERDEDVQLLETPKSKRSPIKIIDSSRKSSGRHRNSKLSPEPRRV